MVLLFTLSTTNKRDNKGDEVRLCEDLLVDDVPERGAEDAPVEPLGDVAARAVDA